MATALDRIIEYKRDEVAILKAQTTVAELEARASAQESPRGFEARLREIASAGQNALICEMKRKSPSAGDILPGADPLQIVREYENGGAACLSVLTDFPSFGGTLEDLETIRSAVSMPILRKDFMIDPIQIVEARAYGADCILVILSALDDGLARELIATAVSFGMDVLTEVHDSRELDRAIALDASLIGVNNRDLKAMKTDLGVSEVLARHAPELEMVSESGVRDSDDIKRLRQSGFRRFLIGESLMKETDRESAVHALVNAGTD